MLIKKGLIDVKAVTVCNQYEPAIHTTDIMLEQYGIDCPLGKADNPQEAIIGNDYALAVDEKWEGRPNICLITIPTHLYNNFVLSN